MANKIWFITGASRGLGRTWATAALERGDKVVVAVRQIESVKDLVATYGENVLALSLDVNNRARVFDAVETAIDHFGKLDVVVSNAGYGLFGTIEESSEADSRAQLETNFFGSLWIIQATLPHFRQQGQGHFLITSSIAGIITFPTAGIYNASKWALEGLTETLAREVSEFGIKVTLIEPGGYATDWRGNSATHSNHLAAYEPLREKLKASQSSRPLGDPEATGNAILSIVDAKKAPLRFFLGTDGLPSVRKAYAERLLEWEAWADISDAAQGNTR